MRAPHARFCIPDDEVHHSNFAEQHAVDLSIIYPTDGKHTALQARLLTDQFYTIR